MPSIKSPASIGSPSAMRSPIEFRMTVMCSTGRPNMASSGPWWLSHKPIVYAQGGANSSPSTAETDQPAVPMSSQTACMQASGSRIIPSASASHSAHRHRSPAGLPRRLRDGFMSATLGVGYDIFGPLAAVMKTRRERSLLGGSRRIRWLAGIDPVLVENRPQPCDLGPQRGDRVHVVLDLFPLPHLEPCAYVRRGFADVAAQFQDHALADLLRVRAEVDHYLDRHAVALADQPEQDVPGVDLIVTEPHRLAQRQLEHLLGPGRERDVPGRLMLTPADDRLDLQPGAVQGHVRRRERRGGGALVLSQQAEQDVLGADVVVQQAPRLFLGQHDDPPRLICEPLEHALLR